MNTKAKEVLMAKLQNVIDGNIPEVFKSSGLCAYIKYVDYLDGSDNVFNLVTCNSQGWEFYSGDKQYPISGQWYYWEHTINKTLYVGEQLELRQSLAKHLLTKLINDDYAS